MEAAIIAAIAAIIVAAYNAYSQNQTNESNQEFTKEQTEKSMEHDTEMAQQQEDYHLLNQILDPMYSMKGYKSIGMSDAAAIQAIAGSGSTGWSPSASNATGAPTALGTAPQFQGVSDILNSFFNNQKTQAETKNIEQDTVFSQQMCRESNARMAKIANDMRIDNAHLILAQDMNDSLTGLYESQRLKNINDLRLASEKFIHEVGLMDAQTAAAYARASLDKANVSLVYEQVNTEIAKQANFNADTTLKNAQVTGQNIANLDDAIQLQFDAYRLEVSKYLQCDVTADIVTQFIEASAAGNAETICHLLTAKEDTESGLIGHSVRLGHYASKKNDYVRNKVYLQKTAPNAYNMLYNNSFTPTWSPFH